MLQFAYRQKISALTILLLSIYTFSVFSQEVPEDDFAALTPQQRILAYNDAADRLEVYGGGINLIYYYTTQALSLLEKYPNKEQTARVYYHLARVSLRLGRLELALSDARNAENLATNKNSQYQILSLLAKIYEELTDYSQALETYKKLSKFKQTDRINLLLSEAHIFIEMNRHSYAIPKAEEALNLSRKAARPQEVLALISLGNAIWKNNSQQAISLFRQAVSRAEVYQIPFYLSRAYFALAQAFHKLGDYADSIFYGQKALLLNRNEETNALDSEIYALLYEDFLALNESTQAINMLKLQYENDLTLIEEKQKLNETFFDASIQVQRLENQIGTLENQKKKMLIFLSILFLIILVLLIFTVLIINQLAHRDAQLAASLVAYNSLKNRTNHLQKEHLQQQSQLLYQNPSESRGVLSILIENYKDLRRTFGDMALEYCSSYISDIISKTLAIPSVTIPLTTNAHIVCVIWPAKNYASFCDNLKKVENTDFSMNIRWQKSEIQIKVKISAYYQTGVKELEKIPYMWKSLENKTK